ncbi:MAG: hypothetical protein LAO03_18250 [Acidobacteriia bacterium]|nr:hypothetical protein [Terriglobia bacterium]
MNLAVLALTLSSLPLLAQQASPRFTAKSATHSGEFKMNAPVDRVFPFFTPAGESDWAEGWNPEFLIPADGTTREGMVFRTPGPPPMNWVATHYDPGKHEIGYVTFTNDSLIRQLAITCRTEGSVTVAAVTYTLTGLSEEGNHQVEEYTEQAHEHRLHEWDTAIDHLLRTGKRLPHHQQ